MLLARISALRPWPFSLTAFRSDQRNHIRITTLTGLLPFSCSIVEVTSHGESKGAKVSRSCSRQRSRHTVLAYLHLKKRCPPSSSFLLQTGHMVSIFMPRLARLHLSGWLLCVSRHRKFLTLFGQSNFQSFSHTAEETSLLPPCAPCLVAVLRMSSGQTLYALRTLNIPFLS